MGFSHFSHFVAAVALLSSGIVNSTPLPISQRDTAERYVFANCVNSITSDTYAAIFWYYPDFLPDFPEPQATAYVNNQTSVDFAGETTVVTDPFTLKATIPKGAATAAEGKLVSTDATAGSFAGPMAVIKGSGAAFYTPETNVNCYEEYWQRDNQSIDP
ncbi:hypothetical protein JX265_001721 [Neoarthrinium moseri]|uniref:Small secreted protein n=1 Tax=Neoarthrinium moseri TaxID=1658444 RepID=A0A9P9WVJ0_9PEZI|nr:hypothetical protein JX265_001721 [Neoarthrinium moseri]